MPEYLRDGKKLLLAISLAFGVAGCAGSFATTYNTGAPAAAQSAWRVSDVRVTVPSDLTTTELNTFVPAADIVWHGEPAGDRAAQVAAIVEQGVAQGFTGLKGGQSVIASVTLRGFHSLTPKAYYHAPVGTGVHSVVFDLSILDARTGAVLAGPERIKADMPANVAAADALSLNAVPGEVWRKQITSHIAATIRSWLGTGPDIRTQFARMGA